MPKGRLTKASLLVLGAREARMGSGRCGRSIWPIAKLSLIVWAPVGFAADRNDSGCRGRCVYDRGRVVTAVVGSAWRLSAAVPLLLSKTKRTIIAGGLVVWSAYRAVVEGEVALGLAWLKVRPSARCRSRAPSKACQTRRPKTSRAV